MTDTDATDPPKKGMGKPLMIGVLLALLAGGGGFWATAFGPLGAFIAEEDTPTDDASARDADAPPTPEVAFVDLAALTIPMGGGRMLLFGGSIETSPDRVGDVTHSMPRILDVLNGFLRVVSVEEVEDPRAMLRLRAQMLRRVQTVVGADTVSDLLITHFVVN